MRLRQEERKRLEQAKAKAKALIKNYAAHLKESKSSRTFTGVQGNNRLELKITRGLVFSMSPLRRKTI
jgi:hypothetical protein